MITGKEESVSKLNAMLKGDSGCNLVGKGDQIAIFIGIFKATSGNPCPGCAWLGHCEFLKKEERRKKMKKMGKFGKHDFKTNAELAKELGISKRQVSRKRIEGTL